MLFHKSTPPIEMQSQQRIGARTATPNVNNRNMVNTYIQFPLLNANPGICILNTPCETKLILSLS